MYTYKAKIRSVYDGDTFRADLYLGFGMVDTGAKGKGRSFRLMGIDTPEVRGIEKIDGIPVRDYVRGLLPVDTEIIITSVKDTSGKYGRYLAYVYIPATEGREEIIDLTEHLLIMNMGEVPEYLKKK